MAAFYICTLAGGELLPLQEAQMEAILGGALQANKVLTKRVRRERTSSFILDCEIRFLLVGAGENANANVAKA